MNTNHLLRATLLIAAALCSRGVDAQSTSADRWPFEAQIGQFAIHSDFNVAANPQFVAQLGSLQADLKKTLQIEIYPEPIHLILFEHQANYQGYMQRYFPTVPFRRALFIKRRGPGMVFAYKSDQMYVDLRHETSHALLNASLPYVPLWLDEGLAEYFESPPTGNARQHTHQATTRRKAFWRQVPTIESLEAVGDLTAMGATEYQEAWSWVHFLLHESDQSRGVLIRFLQELQAHSPPGQLSRRVATELPDWKERYLAHFQR
ncbi:DUF1570 domain-containing protein [Rosistilla carotiformis]|uniref:DUF1570 domain-containing protein n=1 Tax=Rosistilla carotiformis TaxID=2528017 RepID=UPI0011A86506|nr:DUF1570 domain-containing protein [Rosistilla carotiformis]